MNRLLLLLGALFGGLVLSVDAHNFGMNPPTWNREVSRLVFDKCASCHRPGGSSFSLMTYRDIQPRAVEVRDAVMARTMPPWGAVKGFGDFRNDRGLTQEQIELISDWVEGGMQRGNNANTLPEPPKLEAEEEVPSPKGTLTVRNGARLSNALVVDGLVPVTVPERQSLQITAQLPDGRVQPLIWLYEYRNAYRHPFLYRRPLSLPAGTTIRGLPPSAALRLIPLS